MCSEAAARHAPGRPNVRARAGHRDEHRGVFAARRQIHSQTSADRSGGQEARRFVGRRFGMVGVGGCRRGVVANPAVSAASAWRGSAFAVPGGERLTQLDGGEPLAERVKLNCRVAGGALPEKAALLPQAQRASARRRQKTLAAARNCGQSPELGRVRWIPTEKSEGC